MVSMAQDAVFQLGQAVKLVGVHANGEKLRMAGAAALLALQD